MSYRYVNRVPRPWVLLYWTLLILLTTVVPLALSALAKVFLWTIPTLLFGSLAIGIFGTLTTTVAKGEVVTAFGWGLPSRRISLVDVTSQRVTTHRALYGSGIRLVPGGILWRVWGRDSVELTLAEKGRTFSIGTADPEGLLAAVVTALRRDYTDEQID